MKHIARPPDKLSKANKAEVVKDFYKKAEQPKSKVLDWINYNNKAFGNNKEPVTPDEAKVAKAVEERFNDRIQEQDRAKKKIINIVEKPVKPKPLVPEWDWRLGDWTDIFDEDAPPPAPVDIEKVLNIKKKEVAGLEAILNLHKKKA